MSQNKNDLPPYPGREFNNIFWFIQISDIHLSIYQDPKRISDFRIFVQQVLNTVKPSVVFATGDITEAKHRDEIFSEQFEMEWKLYQKILNTSSLVNHYIQWIDLRGNHDSFDVPWRHHEQDMFRKYAVSKHTHSSVFLWTYVVPYGRYSFVGIDASPSPGLRRPYNFFGILHEDDLSQVEDVMTQTLGDNLTLILTHYPSSVINTDHNRMRNIFSGSLAHLCGHLHTFANFVTKMYGHHPDGHLELELGDWKWNRMFRLMAIDHDMFSFTDTSLHHWPLILITNPINSQFVVPSQEPIGRMKYSTHIRVLVFSPWAIKSVTVSIDDDVIEHAAHTEGPLYTLPWQPSKYSSGLHRIYVIAKDLDGHISETYQTFSIDGTHTSFITIPQFLLLSDTRSLIRMSYFFLWFLLLSSLILAWSGTGLKYLQSLTGNKRIFIPLISFIIYTGIGPLFMGEVVRGMYGFVWVHGVYVTGHFVPGSMTYLHGIFEILLVYVPLTLYLAYLTKQSKFGCKLYWHIIMGVSFVYQIWGYYHMILSYGKLTVLISPGYAWGFLLAVVLIWMSSKKIARL